MESSTKAVQPPLSKANNYGDQLLFIIGCSHKQASLEKRESFSLNEHESSELARYLLENNSITECLILKTCNRLEIYGVTNQSQTIDEIYLYACSNRLLKHTAFPRNSFINTQADAVEHNFKLSSGIASQIIGETEILGQMKSAFFKAKELGFAKTVLIRLFEKSFQAGKLIRTQTNISRGQVSIGNVAVELASRIYGILEAAKFY